MLQNKFWVLLIIFFLFNLISCKYDKEERDTKIEVNNIDSVTSENDTISFIFVGDIMMGSNYPDNYSLPPNDGKNLFKEVTDILQDADFTVGNLEGTLLDKGGTPKICDGCVAFRTPTHYAKYLKEAGFDFLNLANNHSNDMGYIGKKSTMNTLDSFGIGYFGIREKPYTNITFRNINIVFIGFARNHYLNDLQRAVEMIREINNDTSIIIVSVHAGAEGAAAIYVNRKRETYMYEDRGNVYEFAHKMIDSGADVVFGHGPHVPRGLELYNNRIIAYSLGNFCTYGKFGLSANLGFAPILKIFVNKHGEFLFGVIFPCKQIKRGIPVPDENNGCIKLMKKLSKSDFPESKLHISSDGIISISQNDE